MNVKRQTLKYIICDYLAALIAWTSFFLIRKKTIEINYFNDINQVFNDANFYRGIVLIPFFWLLLYWATGQYRNVYKKSRLNDLSITFFVSLFGVIIIFFAFLLDDYVSTYKNYYFTFSILFILHFGLTYIPRLILTSITVHKVHSNKIGFPTIMIVSDEKKALQLFEDINNQEISSGYKFEGYLSLNDKEVESLKGKMKFLGTVEYLQDTISNYDIQEIIIVLKQQDENAIYNIIFSIQDPKIETFMPSDRKDLLIGSIKLNAIFSVPLVRISQELMQPWEFSLKRLFDIVVSCVAIIILIPIYLITAIIVKCTSPGPVLYAQERIGKGGKPFKMYKFRSMYNNAEKGIPMLSAGDDDPRITRFGRFMRKVRLDETPQFFHVLKGEMSMVGPRPERQYYIDQIVKKAPEYKLLQKIKPGMTSWGQVKFGYADTVDQMIERLQYDLLYLENMSMGTDIKILLYTFIIILQGRGK